MAEVFGELRKGDATFGEELVLNKLRANLPRDFVVYVECPLRDTRNLRFPDFIVLTNYGVLVLEVKDWVEILKADAYGGDIRTRSGEVRHEKNPVLTARDFAIALTNMLKKRPELVDDKQRLDVPWGEAVVLPNIQGSFIVRLRTAWGEEFVLGKADLEADILLKRLRNLIPEGRQRDLRREELDIIRSVINPSVVFQPENRPAIILDAEQEKVVAEPVKEPLAEKVESEVPIETQMSLVPEPEPIVVSEETPAGKSVEDIEEAISRKASIRLVRGIAGSGKTLVLMQRARYLAVLNPEWTLLVLRFNKALADSLKASLRGVTNIEVRDFHAQCKMILCQANLWKEPFAASDWIKGHPEVDKTIVGFDEDFLVDEIRWMKETGIRDRETYLKADRKGRGKALNEAGREKVYKVVEEYNHYLEGEGRVDWEDIPYRVLQGIEEGKIPSSCYDAILIDEAQDFAPIWIRVLKRLLKKDSGLFFLADDPTQSIYRFYSWLEKGMPVAGRTRWLRVPYRNTCEIYQAAFELIRGDELILKALNAEGMAVDPDLAHQSMRTGEKPLLHHFPTPEAEVEFVKAKIRELLQHKIAPEQIAVLNRQKNGVTRLQTQLAGLGVKVATFHALKGMEYEVVFLTQAQDAFRDGAGGEELSEERRLVYMAMTRARERLYMGYEGPFPRELKKLHEKNVVEFVY